MIAWKVMVYEAMVGESTLQVKRTVSGWAWRVRSSMETPEGVYVEEDGVSATSLEDAQQAAAAALEKAARKIAAQREAQAKQARDVADDVVCLRESK